MADIKITDLASAVSVDDSDYFVLDTGVDTLKTTGAQIRLATTGDLSALTTTAKTSAVAAINEVDSHADAAATAAAKCECLVIAVNGVSSLSQTVSDANIESDMVVVNSVLSNPAAQTSDWTITTGTGTLTIAGTISGTTNITLYLMKSR